MKHSYWMLGVAACSLLAMPALAGPTCASGTSTAEPMTDGPFAGLWKYTLVIDYDTGGPGVSHITLDMKLIDCPGVCDDGMWIFDDPAGESDGEEDDPLISNSPSSGTPCIATYEGSFECNGDPNTPADGPAIKWDDINDDCDATNVGSGTYCFYAVWGPGAPGSRIIYVKAGNGFCQGEVTGVFPDCEGPLPVEPATWGRIKSQF